MKRAVLDALIADHAAKRPVALATELSSGRQCLVYADGTEGELELAEDVLGTARKGLVDDRSFTAETANGAVFILVFNPPLRMVIVGAVHIAQLLAPMAALAGYEVTMVDPRRAFATDARFPDFTVTVAWPDEALERIAPDRRTAIVTLTHDPKLDDPALAVALRSEAFYIGSLGSKKTHAARLERLAELGFGETDFARIHGPVGLPLGAASPAEIAISIMAQVTQVRHQKRAAA